MNHETFAVYMAKLSEFRHHEVRLRYAVCLYDLDLFNPGKKVLPLGYVTEANLTDGTMLSCLIRRDIPEHALSGLGRLARGLFLNGHYLESVTSSLEQYTREAEARGAESILDVTVERTLVTSLCVRNIRPIPATLRDMVGFTDRTTTEEFERIGFKINEKLSAIPFLVSGITSDQKNTFMFGIE